MIVARAFQLDEFVGMKTQKPLFGYGFANVNVALPFADGVVPVTSVIIPELSFDPATGVHVAPVPAPKNAHVGAAPFATNRGALPLPFPADCACARIKTIQKNLRSEVTFTALAYCRQAG